MLYAGLRVSEVVAVLRGDLSPESCSVFVRQGKGSKDRLAPIDVGTIALCSSYVPLQDEILGPKRDFRLSRDPSGQCSDI